MANACLACQVNQGVVVPPGGVIYRDQLWQVDHRLDPSPVLGWLIVKPLRHVEFFDELSVEEVEAFGKLQRMLSRALRHVVPGVQKVYSIMLAESEDCPHVHVHIVPRTADHPTQFRGSRIFDLHEPCLPSVEVERVVAELRGYLNRMQ
ncbi:HIT family protein [Alicyclobacillus sendaiensis]|uniref:HIT family protein n=1 Tax=Alicyclobacillus sendaiensis TaxID=192387 RepID=UPI000780EA7A|nr:hypothetical protein [Alicyclobacillus sendaiensis]